MTTTFRMSDTEMDESPATIGYALVVLLSAIYDCDIWFDGDDNLVVVDSDSQSEMARLEIDGAFGPLMLAVLKATSEELSGTQCTTHFPT